MDNDGTGKMYCAECGAAHQDGGRCQAIFDALLQLEFTDPEYGEVHFLTVTCFMIQHGRYGDEAISWARSMLGAHLNSGLTNAQLRALAAEGMQSGKRTWKILRAADAPPLPRTTWEMTIADVAESYRDAESYRQLVRQWARSTLRQLE